MEFDYDFAVRFLLVLLALVILWVLITQYRRKNANTTVKHSPDGGVKGGKESFSAHTNKKRKVYEGMKEKYEDNATDEDDISGIRVFQPLKAETEGTKSQNHNNKSKTKNKSTDEALDTISSVDKQFDVNPTENSDNEDYKAVDFETSKTNECYPKDRLTTEDLLPKDAANSVWAKNNPAGQGDVKDQNFLQAGVHFGVDTVGQSLRNANMQLRSDPPIPKVDGLSPWMNTTIEYDTNRRFLEIGG